MTKERLMKAFMLFRIMCTMFPILHTHDNPSSPLSSKGDDQGNKRNRLLLARATPMHDFADMLDIESWLKRQGKPIIEHFFKLVTLPFDDCPKHNGKPAMQGKCNAYDEFIMTAGLGHLIRILRGQGFRYVEHLDWVQTHDDKARRQPPRTPGSARPGRRFFPRPSAGYVRRRVSDPIEPLVKHSQIASSG
ncbi:hypothetical protein PG996_012315 [Apiospora saccharicola]|uniref:Uncharacterized protein n=1 Tax=Apiospora saccharicola TaxID=335842 RepID=A0ABR1U506_9PEZI